MEENMLKTQPSISFWNGSAKTINSYLNMEKRVYGMFGTNYTDGIETYFMQFKTGKDGVNDTATFLNFQQLHGRITPIIIDGNKKLLLDFWEFNEQQVWPFLLCLEKSIVYYLSFSQRSENRQTSELLRGSKVSIGGTILLRDGQDYQIANRHTSDNRLPPLTQIYLD